MAGGLKDMEASAAQEKKRPEQFLGRFGKNGERVGRAGGEESVDLRG
jgi:hypothetical protein